VNVAPVVSAINGNTNVCVSAASTLSDTATSGTWSASNGNATVDVSGNVTGVSVGVDTITYLETTGLCTTTVSAIVTVNTAPSISISGNLCAGDTVTLNSTINADSIVWANTGGTLQTNNAGWQVNAVTVAGQSDGTSGSGADELYYTYSVFVDDSENVYVGDYNNARVQKWAPGATSGITVAGNGTQGSAANEFQNPFGIYVDAGGNIYVGDYGNARVQKWAPGATSGVTVAGQSDGTRGIGADQLTYPNGVYVDGRGNVYVADNINQRIQEWAPGATSGITVAGQSDGTSGNGASQLYYPVGVFVDVSGNIYVADQGNNRVQEWAPGATSGVTVAGQSDGSVGRDSSHLYSPAGVYVDGNGNIYIADQGNSRIQQWAPGATSGITVAGQSGGASGTGANQLSGASGVYIDRNGNIYVADLSNSRVQEFMDTIANTFMPTSGGSYTAVVTAFDGCKATDTFNVNVAPVVSAITGNTSVCSGSMDTLSNIDTGGTWTSSNTSVAPIAIGVDGSGIVTGLSQGVDTITYRVTTSCGSADTMITVTVDENVEAITGPSGICTSGPSVLFTDNAPGGNWSTSFGNAEVDSLGNVTGVMAGFDNVNYSVTNSCGFSTTSAGVEIYAPAGAISGTPNVCNAGPSFPFSETSTDGNWGVTTGNASVDGSGNVYGVTPGGDVITYIVTNSCGTTTATAGVTIDEPAQSMTGGGTVCTSGGSIKFTDAPGGGSWNTGFGYAGVDGSGNVYGIMAGSDEVVYTVNNSCGTTYAFGSVNVDAPAGAVGGMGNICVGIPVSFSESSFDGNWSASNGNATVDGGGNVTGVSAGVDTIIYNVTNTCGHTQSTFTTTIDAPAGTITGNTNMCPGGASILFTETSADGSWSASNGNATVDGSGNVAGVSAGMDTIMYSLSNSCGLTTAVSVVTVNAPPVISVSGSLCPGVTDTLNSNLTLDSIVWANSGGTVQTNVLALQTNAVTVAGQSDGMHGTAADELYYPYDAFVDDSGNVYVADTYNSRVQKWAPGATSGTTVAGDGTPGTGASQLSLPSGVFIDGSGNLYVADQINNRVQKWAPGATSGTTVAGDGTSGSGANQLSGPTSLFLDDSENIYVSDRYNQRVQKWAPGATSGTTVAGDGTFGSGASQLKYPQGVFVDSSGNIYVADNNNRRVQEWAPGATSGTTVAGDGSFLPLGIYVDRSGNIYVAEGSNYIVQKWAPGATSGTTVAGDGTPGTGASQLNTAFSVYVDGSGNIYVTDFGNSRIQEFKNTVVNTYTPSTSGSYTAIATTVSGCSATAAFNVNTPVATPITGAANVCANGVITLSDTSTGGTWSSTNTGVATVNSAGVVSGVSGGIDTVTYSVIQVCGIISATASITVNPIPSLSVSASGLCAGSTDTLHSNLTLDSIVWANTGGTLQTNISGTAINAVTVAGHSNGTGGSDASDFYYPDGIFVDDSGDIYIAEAANNRVQKWAPGATSGITVAGTGTSGNSASQLNNPAGIYLDDSENLYVSDRQNDRVQKWAPGATSGTTVAGQSDGTHGDGDDELYYPYGIFVDDNENVYVSDAGNNRVQKWAPGATSGATVAGDGTSGSSASQLSYPAGIYLDNSGNVYVSDRFNNRVQEWAPGATSGATVAGDGTNGSSASQFSYPTGIYVDGNGDIYITDYANSRVQEWAPGATSGTTVAGIGGSGLGPSQLSYPQDVFVDGSRNIYVADASNNRVQEFKDTIVNTYIPGSSGSYTAVVTTVNGCSAMDSFNVNASNAWTGATSTDWNITTNWGCGIVPTASLPAVIPGGIINMPVISTGSFAADSLDIASGNTVAINGSANLNITGTVANLGIVTGSGTLALTGTSAQLLAGNGSISNLVMNNSSGASIKSGDTAYITGMLTMNAGTFTTHSGLTLVSNASGTASIGEITGGSISGNVNCQKYIAVPGTDTNRRAFRFWAHPFSISIPLSQIEKWIDITGSGGSIDGFTTTSTNNPSCEWYNPMTGNSSHISDPGWNWFTSTNGIGSNAFKPKEGINLFIRGEKGQGLSVCSTCYTPSPVTITMEGPVNQGTIIDTMIKGIHSAYNQIGNPYPSPVDIGTVINNAKTGGSILGSAFYVWNPYLAYAGAFEAKTISATPYYLEAYCSFQVQTTAGGKTLTFNESNKSAIDSESLLREEDLYVSLFVYDGSYNTWDKFYLSFNNQATDALDDYDAGKPVNPDLNFYSLSTDSEKLNIDARPYTDGKIIPLGFTTSHQQQYIIRTENINAPAGGQLYLHDKYLKEYTALHQGTEYRFDITNDIASQGDNRFELGLGNLPDNGNAGQSNADGISMLVTPNPANADATVTYVIPGTENASIRVTDVSGAVVMSMEVGAQKNGTVSLNVANLASGVYMVELVSGDKKLTQRLVKE